ncbi:protein of unknown function, DUF4108 family [Trichomonas vaginalis G3]|uniref:protein of unknown function, DUF4108 family n=1 Tax=Trichomonas vaginalis (strain ATCC PRA-98 / G3) TaxID=412133 RepID=UPI0021E5A046|nr:protein of unknown function, DUF4108 family [Trichomonas vaginalis G3]KAI5498304.1 protein of unknown function, DUF4108 family [Trichomonas vaginalis G3]
MTKFISVNKYMTEVKDKLAPFAYLNVYFYNLKSLHLTKFGTLHQLSLLLLEKVVQLLKTYTLTVMLTVKENFDKKFSKLEEGKAYKLVIPYEPKKADDYEYYESKVVEVQGKLGKKILESKPVFTPKEEENIDIDPEMF